MISVQWTHFSSNQPQIPLGGGKEIQRWQDKSRRCETFHFSCSLSKQHTKTQQKFYLLFKGSIRNGAGVMTVAALESVEATLNHQSDVHVFPPPSQSVAVSSCISRIVAKQMMVVVKCKTPSGHRKADKKEELHVIKQRPVGYHHVCHLVEGRRFSLKLHGLESEAVYTSAKVPKSVDSDKKKKKNQFVYLNLFSGLCWPLQFAVCG